MSEVESTTIPGEEVKQVSAQDKKDVEDCLFEVTKTLKRYGCNIAVAILITSTGNVPQIQIVKNN